MIHTIPRSDHITEDAVRYGISIFNLAHVYQLGKESPAYTAGKFMAKYGVPIKVAVRVMTKPELRRSCDARH